MHISEVGIILNGINILNKIYKEKKGKKIDKDLRDALLDAILKMTKFVLSQNVQNFNFGKFKLIVLAHRIFPSKKIETKKIDQSADLIIYGIGKALKVSLVQDLLQKVYEKFISMFPELADSPVGDIMPYRAFLPIFDEILSDLAKSPEERFHNIF